MRSVRPKDTKEVVPPVQSRGLRNVNEKEETVFFRR